MEFLQYFAKGFANGQTKEGKITTGLDLLSISFVKLPMLQKVWRSPCRLVCFTTVRGAVLTPVRDLCKTEESGTKNCPFPTLPFFSGWFPSENKWLNPVNLFLEETANKSRKEQGEIVYWSQINDCFMLRSMNIRCLHIDFQKRRVEDGGKSCNVDVFSLMFSDQKLIPDQRAVLSSHAASSMYKEQPQNEKKNLRSNVEATWYQNKKNNFVWDLDYQYINGCQKFAGMFLCFTHTRTSRYGTIFFPCQLYK